VRRAVFCYTAGFPTGVGSDLRDWELAAGRDTVSFSTEKDLWIVI
jgi:hypothetical protein